MISIKDQIYAIVLYYLHLFCYLTIIYTGLYIVRSTDDMIIYPLVLLTLQLFESCNINLFAKFPVAYPLENYYIIRYGTHITYVVTNILISVVTIYGMIEFQKEMPILYYLSSIILYRILLTWILWTIVSVTVIYGYNFIKIKKSNVKILIQLLKNLPTDNIN